VLTALSTQPIHYPNMNWKKLLVHAIAAFVGLIVADMLVIKTGPNDFGFIEAKPGIGLDDFAVAVTVALVIWLADKFVG
jgi:hypothetical protein